jgi:hypothetical protein
MIHGSMRHTPSGRKIKKVKPKGEVYEKYQPPPFRPIETTKPTRILSYAEQRRLENTQYPSRDDSSIGRGVGNKVEPKRYTGTLVKGIGTMHKSNAIPVIDEQQMKDLASMRR